MAAQRARDDWTDEALRALADPRRRAIVRLVWDGELAAKEVAEHFPVTRQAVSRHLRILVDVGLVAERRDGRRRLYSTRRDQLEQVQRELDSFWTASLARIKRDAERRSR